MWAIQALENDYDVSLITGGDIDLEELNNFYGTSLKPCDFTIRQAPIPFWLALLRKTGRGDALDSVSYSKFCRQLAHEFDVLVSTYNLCDFGVPAIHFIADFSWDDKLRRQYHPPAHGIGQFIYRDNLLRKSYLWFTKKISKYSSRNLFDGNDSIIANSRWTARMMQEKYGVYADFLYPPVTSEFPTVPWEQKEAGFVCISRIAPVKRIERIVEILAGVRREGYDIHLHIIGAVGNDSYGKFISELCKRHCEWVIAEGQLYGPKKAKLLATHRFGAHGCRGEAFGISVAEMVKAGCIVFVPCDGGQAEIVNHPLLTYEDNKDAVRKICNILRNVELQNELRKHLAGQGHLFSVEEFQRGIRGIVAMFIMTKVR
jgi:glycosyltransferase involved in cell wall biosynthesis